MAIYVEDERDTTQYLKWDCPQGNVSKDIDLYQSVYQYNNMYFNVQDAEDDNVITEEITEDIDNVDAEIDEEDESDDSEFNAELLEVKAFAYT